MTRQMPPLFTIFALLFVQTVFAQQPLPTRIVPVHSENVLSAPELNSLQWVSADWSPVDTTPSNSHAVILDWLNWRASRSGLHYAINGLTANTIGPGQIHTVQPNHEFGFRLGLLRQTDAGLDYGLRYTQYDGTTTAQVISAGDLTATRVHADALADVTSAFPFASADYNVDYDVFDWEFGHPMDLSGQASLRPFAGLRFASVDQTMTTTYAQAANLVGDVAVVTQTVLMDAAGVMTGADGRWRIGPNVSLTARMSGGLLAGKSRRRHLEFEPDDNDTNVDLTDWSRRVVTVLEAMVAVSIERTTRLGHFETQFGYDIQSWSNLSDFTDFPDDVVDGKLNGNIATLGMEGFYLRSVLTR